MKPAKPIDPQPWMTRKEARQYLGLSEAKVDYLVVPMDAHPKRVHGKIRARKFKLPGSARIMPRLLKADVYALLPRPDGIEAEETE